MIRSHHLGLKHILTESLNFLLLHLYTGQCVTDMLLVGFAGADPEGGPAPPKIGKNMIFWA
jgi:hypothetical protein